MAKLHEKITRAQLVSALELLQTEQRQLFDKLRDKNTVLDSPNWKAIKQRQREIAPEIQRLKKEIADMDYKEKFPSSFPAGLLSDFLKGGISTLLHNLNGVDLADQTNAVKIMQTIKKHGTEAELEQLATIYHACQKRATI